MGWVPKIIESISHEHPCPLAPMPIEYTYEDGAMLVCPGSAPMNGAADDAPGSRGWRPVVEDANGNVLHGRRRRGAHQTTLKVKGSSSAIKVGTKVKNIRPIDGDHDIDCKIDGLWRHAAFFPSSSKRCDAHLGVGAVLPAGRASRSITCASGTPVGAGNSHAEQMRGWVRGAVGQHLRSVRLAAPSNAAKRHIQQRERCVAAGAADPAAPCAANRWRAWSAALWRCACRPSGVDQVLQGCRRSSA